MKQNRDISIALLKARGNMIRIADPLAGTGIRSLRMVKEIPELIESVHVNDCSMDFKVHIRSNMKLSKIALKKIDIHNEDANQFLLSQRSFDYVDIDPYGSPNQFLDAAIKRTKNGGVLAVTATDTAALCGTYPKACKRKYWANPRRDHLMHEMGLRILIRKCQLIAAQYDKALTPLLSYSKNHYFRVFFDIKRGKKLVDDILSLHDMIGTTGPLWMGQLHNKKLVNKMIAFDDSNLLQIIAEEASVKTVGFYDLHEMAREHKMKGPPSTATTIKILQQKGFQAARTHFCGHGIRSDCTIKDILEVSR